MKEYLVCVDSDGCAMDTMTIKHERCFGPCMVAEWALEPWREPILRRWNVINLYSFDRGINRFKGLYKALAEIDRQYMKIEGLDVLHRWVDTTPAYSEAALQAAIEADPQPILQKALHWSRQVNRAITALPDCAKVAFPGVQESLAAGKQAADLAIVSSANPEALREEWERCGLMQYVDYPMAQDVGTKTVCLQKMLAAGYTAGHILMVGDAPGDLDAANEAGVAFYPILAGHEAESWQRFRKTILPAFVSGRYTAALQTRELTAFRRNLEG